MTKWQRNDGWIGSHIDDSFVMINLENGTYVALNITAADVWELLAEPHDETMLVNAMTRKFSVDPDHCRNAVHTLLTDMMARDLVRSLP